ncbi:MAG: hypothetical protein ACOZAM_32290 [Pseudomonadota bacterium]
MLAFAGFASLYLAAINGILAFTLGTCTQGSADDLLGGGLSLALYLVSIICFIFARQMHFGFLAIVPPLPFIAWQVQFTFRLSYGNLVMGKSACEVIHDLPYEMDGRENLFIGLWAATCLAAVGAVVMAMYRSMPRETA